MFNRITITLFFIFQLSVVANPVIFETTSPTSGLKHPGCLQSAAEINALSVALFENDSIRAARWDWMMNDGRGDIGGTSWAPPVDLFGTDFRSPASNANYGLLRYVTNWVINKDTSSENAAIEILNSWTKVQSFTPDTTDDLKHHRLTGGWVFGYIAHAADMLMASKTSWPVAEQEAFKTTLRNIILPIINEDRPTSFNGNWDIAITWSVMAIAVCLDDKDLFDEQVAWITEGDTKARIHYYLFATGQNQESGRDQGHAQMGLGFMTLICQIAWTQGVDLYEYGGRSLGKNFEYIAAFLNGEDNLPFQAYTTWNIISQKERNHYSPYYELIYHHYKNYRGIELPYVKTVLERDNHEETNRYHALFYHDLDLSEDAKLNPTETPDVTLDIDSKYDGRTIVRINSGKRSGNYYATDGKTFTHDRLYVGGKKTTITTDIAHTDDDELFQSYRAGSSGYNINDLQNGEYIVKLHFVEPIFTENNKRVFNVLLEGSTVLSALDIYSLVGSNTAYTYETTTEISDNELNIEFESIVDESIICTVEIEPAPQATPIVKGVKKAKLSDLNIQTNCFGMNGNIVLQTPQQGEFTVRLFSLTGKLIYKTTRDFNAGQNIVELSEGNRSISTGVYAVTVEGKNLNMKKNIQLGR